MHGPKSARRWRCRMLSRAVERCLDGSEVFSRGKNHSPLLSLSCRGPGRLVPVGFLLSHFGRPKEVARVEVGGRTNRFKNQSPDRIHGHRRLAVGPVSAGRFQGSRVSDTQLLNRAHPEIRMRPEERTPLPHFSVAQPQVFTTDVSVFQAHLPGEAYQ
jgi:hypothetical protein